jgi:hypothetical protein
MHRNAMIMDEPQHTRHAHKNSALIMMYRPYATRIVWRKISNARTAINATVSQWDSHRRVQTAEERKTPAGRSTAVLIHRVY